VPVILEAEPSIYFNHGLHQQERLETRRGYWINIGLDGAGTHLWLNAGHPRRKAASRDPTVAAHQPAAADHPPVPCQFLQTKVWTG
jgi:hypothetical protein